ncbi:YdeI/OmpD-associated family protein [Algoriphagus sp. PAP.12]|uniref:YdeI/OmpD-associated family protein n=1 Tax=Algoriphagus sp. PAP.12 TaxID=2996678 RepID=UPI00227BE4EE|nr:YdeI/OmpD-associated family protein [Algoriphagus sp. PAP.12]
MKQEEKWNEALHRIHEIISKTELVETEKWGMPVFTINGKNVVGYAGMKNHFGLWFYNGVFLSDPYGVLINAQEGKTKAMRQWRFESIEEIDEAKILEYLHEAIQNEKEGKSWKAEKGAEMEIPEQLEEILQADSKLKEAFESFTPFKQKEFIEYISEAKREATKISRLEKIIPMIQKGIGLNDKYR